MVVTLRGERLETFGSQLINCTLMYARAWAPTAGFNCCTHEMGRASTINKANGYWLMACDGYEKSV